MSEDETWAGQEAVERARALARNPAARRRKWVKPAANPAAGPGLGNPGSGAKPSRRDPQLVGAITEILLQARGWSEQVEIASVEAKWDAIAGPQTAKHSQVEAFEDGRLVVRTSSSQWATQLTLLKPMLLQNIAQEVGPEVVTEIQILGPAAPKWTHGRYRVAGRGPRDTYG